MLQDGDWEETEAEDAADKDLLYSAGLTSFSRPTHEHLEAMAKVFSEVCSYFLHVWKVIAIQYSLYNFGITHKPVLLFWKDQGDGYEDDILCVADPLNQVTNRP